MPILHGVRYMTLHQPHLKSAYVFFFFFNCARPTCIPPPETEAPLLRSPHLKARLATAEINEAIKSRDSWARFPADISACHSRQNLLHVNAQERHCNFFTHGTVQWIREIFLHARKTEVLFWRMCDILFCEVSTSLFWCEVRKWIYRNEQPVPGFYKKCTRWRNGTKEDCDDWA